MNQATQVNTKLFERTLKAQREQIIQNIKNADIPSEDYSGDDADINSAMTANNMHLEFQSRSNIVLKRIEEALLRIREGSFGICEGCGDAIEERRLMARPFVTFCITCQEAEELKSKGYGQNNKDLRLS